MRKKIAVSITILLALLYLSSLSNAGLHFGIIDAIKQKGEELKEKVEEERGEEEVPAPTPNSPPIPHRIQHLQMALLTKM